MSTARILVVDDESDIRDLVQEILSEEGYSVETAASAAEASAPRRVMRTAISWSPPARAGSVPPRRDASREGRRGKAQSRKARARLWTSAAEPGVSPPLPGTFHFTIFSSWSGDWPAGRSSMPRDCR